MTIENDVLKVTDFCVKMDQIGAEMRKTFHAAELHSPAWWVEFNARRDALIAGIPLVPSSVEADAFMKIVEANRAAQDAHTRISGGSPSISPKGPPGMR